MRNFQAGGGRSGKSSFQKKSWGASRGGDGEKMMFKATCGECRKSCEVPFRPSGDKPVYCRDCFASKRDAGDTRDRGPRQDRPGFRSDSRPVFRPAPAHDDTRKQLAEINNKLDNLLRAMEKMSAPVQIAPEKAVKLKISKKKAVIKKKAVTKKK